MKATIQQINRIKSGYAVVVDIEGRNPKQFEFGEDVKEKNIKDAITAHLNELKTQEGNLPELRQKLLNLTIEVK